MAAQPGQKRKARDSPITPFNRAAKRVKISSARNILAQTADGALNRNGELDVSSFVKARQFEVEAMEQNKTASKGALSTRAFQQVPRDMRRRSASHNKSRVPKRLRVRAAKEMKEDNTPTVTARTRKPTAQQRLRSKIAKKAQKRNEHSKLVKAKRKDSKVAVEESATIQPAPSKPPKAKSNKLIEPPKPPSLFRKRQIHKTWLPTHLFHAKRAHISPPEAPLWRFAIPLSSTEKSFRATHRAGWTRGCVAWDTSYMSTVHLEGRGSGLINLLRSVGVPEDDLTGKVGEKWRKGRRYWSGWIRERDRVEQWISKVQIIWCSQGSETSLRTTGGNHSTSPDTSKRQIFLRVHPAAFQQIWLELLKVAKVQRPMVSIQDLRFELGSIKIMGPGSTETLHAALTPSPANGESTDVSCVAELWNTLRSLNNPATTPSRAILAFDVIDPRLRHPPKSVTTEPGQDQKLLQILSAWPVDAMQTEMTIFDRLARHTASRLPSQKAINRRKSTANPGSYPDLLPTDPKIPVLLLVERSENSSSSTGQGSWTVILPWKCVEPVWYSLMYYPLSTGGTPRFGGLDEMRQISFEQAAPWFPADYPGTSSGLDWELVERVRRKKEWEKKPKGRRIEWESVDLGLGRQGELGLGWACDWERLFSRPRFGEDKSTKENDESRETGKKEDATSERDAPTETKAADGEERQPADKNADQPDTTNQDPDKPREDSKEKLMIKPNLLHHIPFKELGTLLTKPADLPPRSLITVSLGLIHRGVPLACARIYRFPTKDAALRDAWFQQVNGKISSRKLASKSKPVNLKPLIEAQPGTELPSIHIATTTIMADSSAVPQAGHADYPVCPDEEDLIGFVTTGNFNLGEGRGTGIGCLALEKVINKLKPGSQKVCIIREAGSGIGRVARWRPVD
ncbi:hypothetical protein MMC25_004910 [Agyrium rufum]|nr:hypothetical protein [Agyrium rufum]